MLAPSAPLGRIARSDDCRGGAELAAALFLGMLAALSDKGSAEQQEGVMHLTVAPMAHLGDERMV